MTKNMKRYLRIFSIYIQDMLTERMRSVVWFLLSTLNPLILLMYWNGVYHQTGKGISGWAFPSVVSYYLYFTLASSFISTHIEESVAYYDIQLGGLTKHLLHPFPYLAKNFMIELPYRVLQGSFSLIVIALVGILWKGTVLFPSTPNQIAVVILTISLGYLTNFFYKMVVGISALWFTDYHGLNELLEVVGLVLGGFVVPLLYLPEPWQKIALHLPFASMFYTPVLALTGQGIAPTAVYLQVFWMVVFMLIYGLLWKKGIKQYTAVGI
jgi:ABC-2 type transport system permease protein